MTTAVVCYGLFWVSPLAAIVYSFLTCVSCSVEDTPTLEAWRETVFSGQTLDTFVRTLRVGFGVTVPSRPRAFDEAVGGR